MISCCHDNIVASTIVREKILKVAEFYSVSELIPFPREESVWFWMYRAHSQASITLRKSFQSAGYDITTEQFGVLVAVWTFEGLNQSLLSERLYKDRHNITRILNHLEKGGFVERRTDDSDRRVYRIYLTKMGREAYEKLSPVVLRHQERRLTGLSKDDVATMQRILRHIVNNIEGIQI